MIKNDIWIKNAIKNGMIDGGQETLITQDKMSFGVSSFGYDVILAPKLKYMNFNFDNEKVLDPKRMQEVRYENIWEDLFLHDDTSFVIPPYSFALGHSIEYFKLPRNVTGLVFPKSSYARCGLTCLQTVLEAGWEGQITLEFANVTPFPVKIYANEGCAQVLFLEGENCACSYGDRNGKYQKQMGITFSRV